MKIAVPVDGNDEDARVAASFGRAAQFMVLDPETGSLNFVDNPATESPGGAGIKAAQAILDHGVTVLLTPQCGENASKVLRAAGVTIQRADAGPVKEAVDAYLRGEPAEPVNPHPGFQEKSS